LSTATPSTASTRSPGCTPALAAGIPSSYLSAIERAVKPGSVKALKSLATALDVPLDDLM